MKGLQPLRVFFSSRMQELSYERTLLIEAINDAGHWPRFIENESHSDKESIKEPLDSLISDSDVLVLVTYLTAGRPYPEFGGLTPIEYELSQFSTSPGAVLWLDKALPSGIKREKSGEFAKVKRFVKSLGERVTKVVYTDPFTARADVTKWLTALPQEPKKPLPRFVIRCSTTDCIGQINLVTKFLVERRFNVDYIDQAAKAGKATLYITASQRSDRHIQVDSHKERAEFEAALEDELRKHMRQSGISHGESEAIVTIDPDDGEYSETQIALELRAIDVPGQLFSISRILSDKKLNIDRIDAQPAGPDHRNQMKLRIVVSGDSLRQNASAIEVLRDIEVELGRLIGVRSLTAHLLDKVEE